MAKINVRSPYFINRDDFGLDSAILDIYIYTGAQVSTMNGITFSLSQDAYNQSVSFEISQLIADYIDDNFDGQYLSSAVWVNTRVTKFIGALTLNENVEQYAAFNGYGYFEDGYNPQLSDRILQSNRRNIMLEYSPIRIPVQQDHIDFVDLMYKGEEAGKIITDPTQNLLLHSEDVSSVWAATELDFDLNAIPSGSYFGDKLVSTSNNNVHWIEQTYSKDTTSRDYTASVYVKALEYSRVHFRIMDGNNDSVTQHFDINTQSFTDTSVDSPLVLVERGYSNEGDGWYRIHVTFTSSIDTDVTVFIGLVNDSNELAFIGDFTFVSPDFIYHGLYVRGVQLQEGSLGNYVETAGTIVNDSGGESYPLRKYFTPTANSSDIVRYISYANDSNYVFEDDNNYVFEDDINYIFNEELDIADQIRITYTDTTTEFINIERREECKHTPYKLTFVNKFGVLQDVWMFKRSDLMIDVENKEYMGFNSDFDSYNTSKHQFKTINTVGRESISLNSGFYPEDYNEVFRQLLLSEKVWIKYGDNTLPVNIKSKSLSFKTQVDDKLIDYKIDFDFAFDKINSVY